MNTQPSDRYTRPGLSPRIADDRQNGKSYIWGPIIFLISDLEFFMIIVQLLRALDLFPLKFFTDNTDHQHTIKSTRPPPDHPVPWFTALSAGRCEPKGPGVKKRVQMFSKSTHLLVCLVDLYALRVMIWIIMLTIMDSSWLCKFEKVLLNAIII